MTNPRTVLFLDKVFLKPYETPRGVEIFNANLIRDLAALDYKVTVPAKKRWIEFIRDTGSIASVSFVPCNMPGNALPNGIMAAMKVARSRYDRLLLANVATGLIPAIQVMARFRVFRNCVLIAHQQPPARFLKSQKAVPTCVLAVNGRIAEFFKASGFENVHVYYGITNADSFHPPEERGTRPNDPVRFCVLGHLDNPWKGADTAIEAFRRVRPEIRNRCILHLASFKRPPATTDERVVVEEWMNVRQVPGFLRRMDVLIVPSRDGRIVYETFSQAMVQGMLTGLPVIASNLPILAEKLDGGCGFVFSDAGELANMVERLALDPDLRFRLGERARRRALERYVWDTADFANRFLGGR